MLIFKVFISILESLIAFFFLKIINKNSSKMVFVP